MATQEKSSTTAEPCSGKPSGTAGSVEQFGKVPTQMAMAGKFRGLRRSEYAVYLILACHANENGLSSWPSVKTVASETGLGERTVDRVLKRLRDKGLIELTRRGGGRKNPNVYTLAVNPVKPSDPLSDAETPSNQVTPFGDLNPVIPDRKPRQTDTETPSNGDLNPVISDRNPVTWNDPRTEEQIEQKEAGAADAAFSDSRCEGAGAGGSGGNGRASETQPTPGSPEEKLAAMADAGIQPNDRIRALAESPYLTVEKIGEHVQAGSRNGLLVNKLQEAVDLAAEADLIREREEAIHKRQAKERADAKRKELARLIVKEDTKAALKRHTLSEVVAAYRGYLSELLDGVSTVKQDQVQALRNRGAENDEERAKLQDADESVRLKKKSVRKNTRFRSCTTDVAAILEPDRKHDGSRIENLVGRAMVNIDAGYTPETAVAEAMANAPTPRESEAEALAEPVVA